MEQFKYLGTTLTNRNSIQKEINSGLKSGNACCYSVQNILSSSLLPKNIKMKIHRTIILPVVLYGCEIWSLAVREERKLRVCENRILRRIFGCKRDAVTRVWRKLHIEELYELYSSPNIIWMVKSVRMKCAGHVARMGRGGKEHTGFWWGKLRERDHLEDKGVDRRIILKGIFRCWDGALTALIWLGRGRDGGPLWMR